MKTSTGQAVILMGSNIHPETNLVWAMEMLTEQFRILQISHVWETPAVGSNGPNFLNAAILLESKLSPQVLKEYVLRPIEADLGRLRTEDKNAPRTIDLDVVVWRSQTWDDAIWQYAHAAMPVAELVPDLFDHSQRRFLGQAAQKLFLKSEIRLRSGFDLKTQLASELNHDNSIAAKKLNVTSSRADVFQRGDLHQKTGLPHSVSLRS